MSEVYPELDGWDTVLAVRIDDFNRLLSSAALSTEHKLEWETKKGPAVLEWRFGDWQLVDVMGSQITLEIRFADAHLSYQGQQYELASIVCQASCEMVLKPRLCTLLDGRTPHALASSQADNRQWVSLQLDDPQNVLGFSAKRELKNGLDKWFLSPEAVDRFDKHFAGLNINTIAAQDKLAWLKPSAVGFAGATMPGNVKTIGLLSRINADDAIGARYRVSPYAIHADAQASFLISAKTFLCKMLVPALPKVFGGSPEQPGGSFEVYDGNKVRNTETVHLSVDVDGTTHTGTIVPKQLDIVLDGHELVLRIHDMTFPIDFIAKEAKTVHVALEERLELALESPKEDPDHRVFTLVQKVPSDIKVREEESLAWTFGTIGAQLVLTIVGALASYFGAKGLASRGLSLIASRLIGGLILVVAEGIGMTLEHMPELIAGWGWDPKHLSKAPRFDTLLDVSLSEISWPTKVRFRVLEARFADHLQVDICITEKP